MKNSAIVGMGRTGTTALREILLYLYKINKAKGISNSFRKGPLRYSHWDKSCIDFKESVVIICKRDLRDVLASNLINFPKRNSVGAFEASQAWKIKHPKHITNSGATQSWHDIFSEAQEKVIIDNFSYWLKKQGYING